MTIPDASIRRVLRSAHAREQRWAKADRAVGMMVSSVLWPLAVCGMVAMLIGFSTRRAK